MTITKSISSSNSTYFWLYLIAAAILMQIPVVNLPFVWAATFFHELSHAIAAILTGGEVSRIQLFINGAGLCFSLGGIAVVIAFSGYFGAPIFGFLLYKLSKVTSNTYSKYLSISMLAIISLVLILWSRDLLTILILIVLGFSFFLSLKYLNTKWLKYFFKLFGMSIMLNGISSVVTLLNVGRQGDAYSLAQMTWIPALVWVLIWCATNIAILYSAKKYT
ncbi:M50 family peptidase [Parashewanella spongiae]|uniref:M50 family peptidase n=1 Tax=Parashewanella spongiae TaxID=342950 RepID=A0A3A6UC41_9GAMM|nr:M50 family metallopeptidase [Parashewanella spongiae]MCL1076820.1 M50 family metallopeptidase [Parashewanella spongiae]RJY19189.1 M50 family peptidase [Parashewanella spongiae]